MPLPRDECGVEGIPLRLIIALVILAITVPIAWRGLESYDHTQTESNLVAELDFLAANIKQVYLNGLGNARDVEVDFKEGMVTRIERVEIGDTRAGVCSSIRYKLGYKSPEYVLIENPNIPVGNGSQGDFGPLVVGSGRHTLHLESRTGLDFNDDGNPDLYVEASRVG